MTDAREIFVAAAQDGERLDKALELLLPGAGLRLRRRLIEAGRVHVEGRPAPAGLKLRQGQRLQLLAEAAQDEPVAPLPLVVRTRDFAALNKPAGLHSARLAGGGGESAEAQLPALFPDVTPRLLNRLDFLTSGLLLVALTEAAARRFAALDVMRVVKEYAAVVVGRLDEPLELRRRLDTDDRKRTRVLGRMEPDERAWTYVWPEAELASGLTLVRVRIHAGARHQIRAHLAAASLPILGDPLYGEGSAAARLYLHHRRMEFPGFAAEAAPDWPANWPEPGLAQLS